MIGAVISHKQATLHELNTVYTLEDLFDLYEIIEVDNYNKYLESIAIKNHQENQSKKMGNKR